MRSFVPLVLLSMVALGALGACGGVDCTANLATSVSVRVVDANGAAVPDAKVTYSVDGGASETAGCWDVVVAGCKQWIAGQERTGHFVVRAESADGTKHDEATADVTEGECHVQGKSVTLTL
jgi:hypothetical protein